MTRNVWFQLVDREGNAVTSADCADCADGAEVFRLRRALKEMFKDSHLAGIAASDLTVFANWGAYAEKQALEPDSSIGSFGGKMKEALIVAVPAVNHASVQEEKLLKLLEWKGPRRLCGSTGQDWPYQGAAELGTSLKDPLVQHYKAWQHGNQDKQMHALFLVMSGPGTGKSRMLDEMKHLLGTAAELSGDHKLVSRMKEAYEFHVTFENGTSATGKLLDSEFPEFDVSYRMMYQLGKDRKDWPIFAYELNQFSRNFPLTIGRVIDIVATLEKIDDVKDMTVILCVDGLQKLVNDGTKTCDFYRVLTAICSFFNSSRAFAVCVCSATVQSPVDVALSDSPQKRVFLLPPALRGQDIFKPRTWLEKQLVDDMGGHGRALETLGGVIGRYTKGDLEKIDPVSILHKICDTLRLQYGDIFASAFFQDPTNCQEVLAVILARRRYGLFQRIGRTDMTVDGLRSFGMFRWTSDGHVECAFILLEMLMREIPKKVGEVDNFDEHITRSLMVWQRFEHFMAFYRRVKSIVFCEVPVPLSEFHAGARFGVIDGILIKEPHTRTVVEAISRHDTKLVSEDSICFTDRDGNVKLSDMKTIVINGTSASAGDLFLRVQLVEKETVQCNEVIQCKFSKTKKKMNKATYEKEQAKGIKGNSDVFLLITTASLLDDFPLPPRCGIVSIDEFPEYFGPFASRAYRSLLEPPNINTASYRQLRLIEGVGDATATSICQEKTKRGRLSSHEDALSRLGYNKKSKTAEILGYLQYDVEDKKLSRN